MDAESRVDELLKHKYRSCLIAYCISKISVQSKTDIPLVPTKLSKNAILVPENTQPIPTIKHNLS